MIESASAICQNVFPHLLFLRNSTSNQTSNIWSPVFSFFLTQPYKNNNTEGKISLPLILFVVFVCWEKIVIFRSAGVQIDPVWCVFFKACLGFTCHGIKCNAGAFKCLKLPQLSKPVNYLLCCLSTRKWDKSLLATA